MRQQVNLLAPMFRKQRTLFSARVTLAICVATAATLGATYGITAWRVGALGEAQARLAAQRQALTDQLNQLGEQYKTRGHSPALDAQVEALTRERDGKQQALATLSRRELGNTHGFSPQLAGLARQRLNGLWLTRVAVSSSGAQIALEGVTLSESLIPQYLAKLGGEPVFSGLAFAEARLERSHDGGQQLAFELRTGGGAAVGGAP